MSNTNSSSKSPIFVTLIKGLSLIGVIVALFWGIRYCFFKPVEGTIEKTANAIVDISSDLFQTTEDCFKFVIEKSCSHQEGATALIIQKTEQVADFVTLERTFEHEYIYTTTWVGSTKKLTARAGFKAFGGINMDKPEIFRLIFPANDTDPILIDELQGKMIACEMIPDSFSLQGESGLINKITESERSYVIQQLQISARKKIVEETDFLQQAERNFIQLIKEKANIQRDIQNKDGRF